MNLCYPKGAFVLMNVMAAEFGAPYTKAATHSRYTLPLTTRATLEADLAALPFEIIFLEQRSVSTEQIICRKIFSDDTWSYIVGAVFDSTQLHT